MNGLAVAQTVLTSIAQKFTARERHRLSDSECEIVEILEKAEYLSIRNPADGFVGEITRPRHHGY